MKNIVFLDIDGVLNSPDDYAKWDQLHRGEASSENDEGEWINPIEDHHILALFNQDNIAVLNRITDLIDGAIVISSSWRLMYSSMERYELLLKILRDAGVKAPIIGRTPVNIPDRATAVDFWINNHRVPGVNDYVILDDFGIDAFGHYKHLMDHLIQTNYLTGLVEEDINRVLTVLAFPRSK